MGRSWKIKDTDTCLFCDSSNIEHWIDKHTQVVVHKCLDCKQQWSDSIEE